MSALFEFWPFVGKVLLTTLFQLLSISGVFFVFGLILYLLARYTRRLFVNILGEKSDIYFTGWIGTPVHELGHALLCIPFLHRITEIKLYSPNGEDGTLGYVNHAYNPRNPWSQIGNFFIALGPILFGSLIIYLLVRFLLPNNQALLTALHGSPASFTSLSGFMSLMVSVFASSSDMIYALFTGGHLHQWQFWVFLYLAICISAHMELSPPDLKGLGSGLLAIIIILLIVNIILILLNVDAMVIGTAVGRWTSLTTGIFTLAVAISAMTCLASLIILNIISLIINKKIFI